MLVCKLIWNLYLWRLKTWFPQQSEQEKSTWNHIQKTWNRIGIKMCEIKARFGFIPLLLLPLLFDGFVVASNMKSSETDGNLVLVQTVGTSYSFHLILVVVHKSSYYMEYFNSNSFVGTVRAIFSYHRPMIHGNLKNIGKVALANSPM